MSSIGLYTAQNILNIPYVREGERGQLFVFGIRAVSCVPSPCWVANSSATQFFTEIG